MMKPMVLGSLLVILLFSNAFGYADAQASSIQRKPPAPGRMIDIGGYRLHLYCEGEGSPTVIMEAGLGNPGLAWSLIQPAIAEKTRVCVYDRAGLGWSDPSPRERTAKVMVDELHVLLYLARIEPPYVLVGHSFGGLIMRLYAHTYPDETRGLVFVDSYHYTQMERYPEVHGDGNMLIPLSLRLLDVWIASGIPAHLPSLAPVLDLGKLPPKTLETYRDLASADTKSVKEAQEELEWLKESSLQEQEAAITSLGNIPLIVLSHGFLEARPFDPIGDNRYAEYEIFWRADQAKLASLSSQGELIIAGRSGHYIQLDEPLVVIEAIERVLAEGGP